MFIHCLSDIQPKQGRAIAQRLVACLSPQRIAFNPKPLNSSFEMDKVALAQVFSPRTLLFRCQYHSTNAKYSSSP